LPFIAAETDERTMSLKGIEKKKHGSPESLPGKEKRKLALLP
jgi:hypothetical protein